MKILSVLFTILISGGLAKFASADDLPAWQQKTAAAIQLLQQDELFVGGCVGISFQGSQSVQSFGETAPGSGVSPTSKSLFEIGSTSKSFTGILLEEIVDETPGMSIDDLLSKYLPELNGSRAGLMTLRQLATHTSGLPRMPCKDAGISYCMHPKDPSNPYADYTASQLMDYFKNFTLTDYGPYPMNYSNTGFAALGYLLTRIEQKSFDDLVAERITIPLGMADTFVERPRPPGTPVISGFLSGFDIDRSEVTHWVFDVFAPTGGIVSTADDMMKYLAANLHPPATPLGVAMQKSQALGLGWDSPPGAPAIFKNGQTNGFHSILFFRPARSIGAFVLGNLGSTYTDYVAVAPLNVPVPDLAGMPLPDAELKSYIGSYKGIADAAPLEIALPGKFLILTLGDQKLRLDATSDTEFNGFDGVNPDGTDKVTFLKAPDGRVTGLTLHLSDGKGHIQDVQFER